MLLSFLSINNGEARGYSLASFIYENDGVCNQKIGKSVTCLNWLSRLGSLFDRAKYPKICDLVRKMYVFSLQIVLWL